MKTRVISAIVMLAIVGVCVFLSPISRSLLVCVAGLLSVLEMGSLFRRLKARIMEIPLMVYLVLQCLLAILKAPRWLMITLYGAVFFSIFVVAVFDERYRVNGARHTLSVLNYPVLLYGLLMAILTQENWMVVAAVGAFSTWFCDAFAMFGGKWFGKHPLCPTISPKKTVEGTVTGAVASLLGGLLAWYVIGNESLLTLWAALVVAVIASSMGQIGDLAASLYKREAKLKDYSHLIPGHGGMMDRADSLLFAIPTAWACLEIIELFV